MKKSLVVIILNILGAFSLIIGIGAFVKSSTIVGYSGITALLIMIAVSIPFFFFAQVLDNLEKQTSLLESIEKKISNKEIK